jgi:hypothetical protein
VLALEKPSATTRDEEPESQLTFFILWVFGRSISFPGNVPLLAEDGGKEVCGLPTPEPLKSAFSNEGRYFHRTQRGMHDCHEIASGGGMARSADAGVGWWQPLGIPRPQKRSVPLGQLTLPFFMLL